MTDQTNEPTSLTELRDGIRAARASIHDAIAEAAHAWAEAARVPDSEESWPVRRIAEHALESEYFFANSLATGLGRPDFGSPSFGFASADEALAALHASAATTSSLLAASQPGDLEREATSEMTVADALGAYAFHFQDHADQVRAIVAALAPA